MTLQASIDRYRRILAYDFDDYDGEDSTDERALENFNLALRLTGRECFLYDINVGLTLTLNEPIYSLLDTEVVTKRVIEVHTVTINGKVLYDRDSQIGVWDWPTFQGAYPAWRDAESGAPRIVVQLPENKILVHPAPDSDTETEADGSHYISGQVLPPTLTIDDYLDELPITEELHEAVTYLAAVIAAEPTATEGYQFQKMMGYSTHWKNAVKRISAQNRGVLIAADPEPLIRRTLRS